MGRKAHKPLYTVKIKQNGKSRLLKISASSPDQAADRVKAKNPSSLIMFVRKFKFRTAGS